MTTDEKGNPLTYWGGLEKPKKKTLEEVAEKWLNKDGFNIYNHYDTRPSFIAGAKWQQQNSYSEEEVEYLLYSFKNYLGFGEEVNEKIWFEQFKKK